MSRHSQDYVNSITDAIDDGLVVIERDYTISFANKAYANQVGMTRDEILGQKCHLISHGRQEPCLPPEHECPLKKVLETSLAQKVIHRHLDIAGKPLWVEVSCSPMFDEQGRVVRAVEVTRDITERKRMEREFLRAEQLANLGQMATTVAHEIRNPLAGMRGALEVIQSRTEDRSQAAVVDQIIEQIDRVSRTTQVLLDFARPAKPRKAPVSLDDLIEKTNFLIEDQAKSQGCEVVFDLEQSGRHLDLDPRLTVQAFLNIALNALQAMTKGGTLCIKSRWLSTLRDPLKIRYDPKYAEIQWKKAAPTSSNWL